MHETGKWGYYVHLATEKNALIRAVRVALLVGIILNLINNPDILFTWDFHDMNIGKVLLIFVVPFCVSTYSSILSNSNLRPGKISHLDALLKCKSCKQTDFHVHIGQPVDECPECKKNTRWKLVKLFSVVKSDNELLKSLALFARYNPQPLFRIDAESVIIGANPASEALFEQENLTGQELEQFIPELGRYDLPQLIKKGEAKELMITYTGKFYNLVLRGVPVLNSLHVYGNDITDIVLAEEEIKRQAGEIQKSIQYAWRIQQAMLPEDTYINQIFPRHFIYYLPRNTVSGDFYWVNQVGDCRIFAVADCTGHGVPGAFMSMMGISLLNEIILREKIVAPAQILNTLRERLTASLKAKGKTTNLTDGMDISLVVMNEKTGSNTFAGAFNPLYLIRNGELNKIEADRMPVGEYINDTIAFTEKSFHTLSGDRLIMFTDGYKDQFGGDKNKKFSARQFKDLLLHTSGLTIQEQLSAVQNSFETWKKDEEQVDDVLVVGLEIE